MLIAMETGISEKNRWSNDYGLEIKRREWNSTVARLQEAAAEPSGRMSQRHEMPTSMASVDVDAFLRVMTAARR